MYTYTYTYTHIESLPSMPGRPGPARPAVDIGRRRAALVVRAVSLIVALAMVLTVLLVTWSASHESTAYFPGVLLGMVVAITATA